MMRRLLSLLFGGKRGRAGNAMLEFAIGAGVMLSAFSGTFEFGYTFYRYNSLAAAVNDGARYASLKTYNSSSSTPTSDFQTAVQNMVVYGNPGGGSSPIAPGLTTSNVKLTVTFTNSVPSAVTVSITGYSIDAVFATKTFSGKPAVTYPYIGIYQPF